MNAEELLADLEDECLHEVQHIPVEGGPERRYFSRGELEDILLVAVKQVRGLDEIPDSVGDIQDGERLQVMLVTAAMALRKLSSDISSGEVGEWKRELWGETQGDRVKTAGGFNATASEYEQAASDLTQPQ